MSDAVIDAVVLARCRLARFANIDRRWGDRMNPRGKRLLRHVIFDEYLVMRAAGLGAEARLLMAPSEAAS